MAKKKQPRAVRVEITRKYIRGGTAFPPGVRIVVPEYAVPGIVNANPPFGVIVEDLAAPAAAPETEEPRVEEELPPLEADAGE